MPIRPLPELLERARDARYALGYFEAWDVYTLEAVLAAAEAEQSPLILGIGGLSADHAWLRSHGIEIYGAACDLIARRTRLPVSILFNEADSLAEAEIALGAGYNAVMMHTQGWPWERLVGDTKALVLAAHELDVAVEGEVGALAEMRGGRLDEAASRMTGVDEAVAFVEATGVDCLAVAVGNVHFVHDDHSPTIDTGRIREIRAAVAVPLVLHGGSGTPADQVVAAIEAGISKLNVGTRLKRVYGAALSEALRDGTSDANRQYGSRGPDDVCLQAAAAVTMEARRLMRTFGSSGRAAT
jgi:ketose-bisphosphate aldolase